MPASLTPSTQTRSARDPGLQTRTRRTALGLALAATALLAVGCGGAPKKPVVEPGPAIKGLNLTGKWYSKEFGTIMLTQNGAKVIGTYEHPRGPEHNGRIRGTIEGDLLRIEWIQPGDPSSAVFTKRGKAYFRIGREGKKLDGRWGYKQDDHFGGPWSAEKSQFQ
jgi:hypothetical protein